MKNLIFFILTNIFKTILHIRAQKPKIQISPKSNTLAWVRLVLKFEAKQKYLPLQLKDPEQRKKCLLALFEFLTKKWHRDQSRTTKNYINYSSPW